MFHGIANRSVCHGSLTAAKRKESRKESAVNQRRDIDVKRVPRHVQHSRRRKHESSRNLNLPGGAGWADENILAE